MAYASQSGRARTDPRSPQAFAVCQRCSIWYNRVNLFFQWQWRGASLVNTFILVCKRCLDIPTEQNRAIVLPADPMPIFYPSVEDFAAASSDYRAVTEPQQTDQGIPIPLSNLRVTQDCQNRTTEPYGPPTGLVSGAIMPFQGKTAYGVALPLLSVTSNGTHTVTVTCSAVHNLQPNDQVSVAGMVAGNGLYSVAVPTATVFTYQTYAPIVPLALLRAGGQIRTANVGLPYGYTQVPVD